MTVNIEKTILPCGAGCGAVYSEGGLEDPAQVQRRALDSGWAVRSIEGRDVIVCPGCAHDTALTANRLYSILARLMDLRCADCDVAGVRMWRLPHMTDTKCARCCLTEQAQQLDDYRDLGLPDQWPHGPNIGDRIPAILDADGSTWGLTSVPPQALSLWRSLPDNAPPTN